MAAESGQKRPAEGSNPAQTALEKRSKGESSVRGIKEGAEGRVCSESGHEKRGPCPDAKSNRVPTSQDGAADKDSGEHGQKGNSAPGNPSSQPPQETAKDPFGSYSDTEETPVEAFPSGAVVTIKDDGKPERRFRIVGSPLGRSLCRLGADILAQLHLHDCLMMFHRDIRPSNILARQGVISGGPATPLFDTQGAAHAAVLPGSRSASDDPQQSPAVTSTPPEPAQQYPPESFTLCDFDLASVPNATEQWKVLMTWTSIVHDPIFQPHTLRGNMLNPNDGSLSLCFVLAVVHGGWQASALPWASAEDVPEVLRTFDTWVKDEDEVLGLGDVHREVANFVHAAKRAQWSFRFEEWSARLRAAADELGQ
ncbi:hypothetical protein KFL_001060100 [Klebsormidium nitens]|uniref:Protein kinase domain-containing protein n=1 Tax=Klebsormidium nitens TaxID=105231 RepID=A0A1Y1I2C2_KLENI|nr:hypothetical protein KFL_001060100 [Klebsormidium nitens]|eukprot:GAQ82278.1 hypothetical protein KFL_001060100 [Klebsormidium nitens]